jgi:four helix bundle protein
MSSLVWCPRCAGRPYRYRRISRRDSSSNIALPQPREPQVSVPANIAEGFKRRGIGEKVRFYNQAEASLEELKYYFLLSRDLGYIPPSNDLIAQSERVGRLLSGLISSTERRR